MNQRNQHLDNLKVTVLSLIINVHLTLLLHLMTFFALNSNLKNEKISIVDAVASKLSVNGPKHRFNRRKNYRQRVQ